MLKNAVVIEGTSAGDVVEPGVLVELRTTATTTPITYLVGSIEERHDTYDVLSTESPLGQALLGAAPGATGAAIRARSASSASTVRRRRAR